MKCNYRVVSWMLVLVVSLAAQACRGGDRKGEAQAELSDLADLNEQIRPYVTTAATKVRSGPGTQFRAIADIGPDAKVNVVGRDGEWVLIVSKKGNLPGYIERAAVRTWTGETAKETVRGALAVEGPYEALTDTQLRSGPGLHYPVIASIARGTSLHVVEEDKGWLKVESKRGNEPGYVEAGLTRPSP